MKPGALVLHSPASLSAESPHVNTTLPNSYPNFCFGPGAFFRSLRVVRDYRWGMTSPRIKHANACVERMHRKHGLVRAQIRKPRCSSQTRLSLIERTRVRLPVYCIRFH